MSAPAIHESAHAGVAERLGLRVLSATVERSGAGLTTLAPVRWAPDDYERNAVVCLAADVAESLVAPRDWSGFPARQISPEPAATCSSPTHLISSVALSSPRLTRR